jgi:hypothetical protein
MPTTSTTPRPVDLLVDRLVHRHALTPRAALDLLRRAALRKGTTLDVLVARILDGRGPTPTPAAG